MNLLYHQQRVDRCGMVDLEKVVREMILPEDGVYKLRVAYRGDEVTKVDIDRYVPKVIETLRVVDGGDYDYSLKSEDRIGLTRLHEMRGVCDDVLITKGGMVTDTSFCNILFSDGERWVTPKSYLLAGTCRARLIDESIVTEEEVCVSDIKRFKYFMPVNAMLDFDLKRKRSIEGIVT